MADWYIRSGAAGTATGADWTNAKLTLAAALTAGVAGDRFFVSEDHAETQASALTLSSPGTGTSPTFIYCVNHAGTVPPVSADLRTTATISTTGNSAVNINSINGYCYGITFNCGSGAVAPGIQVNNASSGFGFFKSCAFRSNGTNASSILFNNNTASRLELMDCTVQFGNTGSNIQFGSGYFRWSGNGSSITGATLPTTLVTTYNSAAEIIFNGVDLSAIGSGGTLFGVQASDANVKLVDCKLGASVTVAAAMASLATPRIEVISCDSAATNYRHERYRFEGVQTVETTIVRTGGASDGTTTLSQKIVTTANSKWIIPFESFPISIWNDSTSAITTLTIYGTTTGGGVPNNDDIWVEVEYLGSALTPAASFITTTKADNLAASVTTNNSSDASTWGGGGAGNGFKIVVPSFTPGMKGPINITIKVAKASSTYYIDPRPSISGVTVSKSEVVAPGVYINELSSGGASAVQYRPNMSGNV